MHFPTFLIITTHKASPRHQISNDLTPCWKFRGLFLRFQGWNTKHFQISDYPSIWPSKPLEYHFGNSKDPAYDLLPETIRFSCLEVPIWEFLRGCLKMMENWSFQNYSQSQTHLTLVSKSGDRKLLTALRFSQKGRRRSFRLWINIHPNSFWISRLRKKFCKFWKESSKISQEE